MIHENIIQKLTQAVERANLPGMAAMVVNRSDILFSKGWGVRRMGDPAPVDADTLFAIASNTKAFTASAIGLLVDEGKLAWDAPVLEYLPDFQLFDAEATRKITVRDLLCHRCGLATWGGDLTWYGSNYSMEEVLRRVRYQPPAYDFRTGYGYCNLMFMTAGLILERVSGQTFGQFLQQHLFTPLGMARTQTSTVDLEGMDNIASPHTPVNGTLAPVPYRNTDNNTPAG
ncbi:MAG: serine hydrolase domain-containing protein, partial [Anaerolineaceae bacterium]